MTIARLRLIVAIGLALPASQTPVRGQNSFADDIRKTKPPARVQPQVTAPTNGVAASGKPAAPDAPAAANPRFAKFALIEAKDFGVAPTNRLRGDPMHAPTPTRIEGGLVITTEALHALYESKPGSFIVFDVLGGQQRLPNAQNALPASRAGSFSDATQREFANYLQKATGNRKDLPLVFYCQSVYCWMSYNAALRAINLGYTKVFWYRGGIEAWQQVNLPTHPAESSGGR